MYALDPLRITTPVLLACMVCNRCKVKQKVVTYSYYFWDHPSYARAGVNPVVDFKNVGLIITVHETSLAIQQFNSIIAHF